MVNKPLNEHRKNKTLKPWVLLLAGLVLFAIPGYDNNIGFAALSTVNGWQLYLIALLPVVWVYLILFSVSGRCLSAALLTTAVFAFFLFLNYKKIESLSAPLLYDDLFFFRDWLSSYRVFSEYISIRASKVTILIVLVSFLLWIYIKEKPVLKLLPRLLFLLLPVLLISWYANTWDIGAGYRKLGIVDRAWSQIENQKYNGMYTVFVLSAYNTEQELPEQDLEILSELHQARSEFNEKTDSVKPDIIFYLSEALFDVGILSDYDECEMFKAPCELQHNAVAGSFDAPTFGGGTTRTEFAVITGVDVLRFRKYLNIPYRKVMHQQANSIAWELKKNGYRTVAIHPNHAAFYSRNIAMPNLGFDEFISRDKFTHLTKQNGTYINDADLNQQILATLEDSDQPVFILAISIENHGPWGKRKIREPEKLQQIKIPSQLDPQSQRQLREYIYHTQYAEQALIELYDYIQGSEKPAALFFYGDHLPALETVFDQLEFDNGLSARQQHSMYFYTKNFASADLPPLLAAHQVTPLILHDLKLLKPNNFYDIYRVHNGYYQGLNNSERQAISDQAQLQQLYWQH